MYSLDTQNVAPNVGKPPEGIRLRVEGLGLWSWGQGHSV